MKKTGKFILQEVYTVVEVKNRKGAKAEWEKLKSGIGWISLNFVKKV